MKYIILFFILASLARAKGECQSGKMLKVFKPKYALGFYIEYFANFKIIHSKSYSYILNINGKIKNCSNEFEIKKIPERLVLTSTTYITSIEEINLENTIVGFQGVDFIYSDKINKKNIVDVGYSLEVEQLLKVRPELVIAYEDNLSNKKKLEQFYKFNIPIVFNYDYFETNALARAEWRIFNAAFFDKEELAIKKFNEIEIKYLQLKENQKSKKKKQILMGTIENGKWVTPGGSSDLAQIIEDAGGELILKRGSNLTQYISLEEIKTLDITPDLWILNNGKKGDDFIKINPHYKKFLNIDKYNYTKKVKNKANDYWESGVARPDMLLEDFVKMFNGDNSSLIWYSKI